MKKKEPQTKKAATIVNQLPNSVEQIEITIIDCNPNNPRKHYPEEDIQELSNSIAVHGVIQPITLRKVDERYQIVCGERRYRAAKMAGLTSISAIVREYTQEQAIEVTIIENLQRKDILPMEEATSFSLLMKEHNYTVEDLIKRFGKSEKYIRGRLQLSNLVDKVAQLLNNSTITISVALIISGYSEDIQNEVYDEHITTEGYNSWRDLTANKFQERIKNKYASNLNKFDFDKEECLKCNFNTANNTLFSDSDCGSCTNRSCMLSKQQAYMIAYCKEKIEADTTVAFCVTPNSNADDDVVQAIGEAGGDIFEIHPFSYPVAPQIPTQEENDADEDYEAEMQTYDEDSKEYSEAVATIEEKIASGKYQRLVNISENIPKICFRIVIPENTSITPATKEDPIKKLQEKDARNKEIAVEKTIEDVKKMLHKSEVPSTDITDMEDELLYFVMLTNLRHDHKALFGLKESYSIPDETKSQIIKNLTAEQKAIIKRDFIIKHFSETFGTSRKSDLLLDFARLHFNSDVDMIIKPYEKVYKKRRKGIVERLGALGGSLSSIKVKESDHKEEEMQIQSDNAGQSEVA